jgi:hypothetical protein
MSKDRWACETPRPLYFAAVWTSIYPSRTTKNLADPPGFPLEDVTRFLSIDQGFTLGDAQG